MAFVDFLCSLFEDGRVTVPNFDELSDEVLRSGDGVIARYEAIHRVEMPGDAPPLVDTAARWAAVRFYRACQFAVNRDADEDLLNEELGVPLNDQRTPSVHYSVDLLLQYLPDLFALARSAAEHDPLVAHLQQWAREWPLSSVGMAAVDNISIEPILADASLTQLYLDRVIAKGDESRLTNLRIRKGVQASVGMHTRLAKRLKLDVTQD